MKKWAVGLIIAGCLILGLLAFMAIRYINAPTADGERDHDAVAGGAVTRGELITMLYNGMGMEGFSESKPYFSDVTETSEFFAPVQTLYEWGALKVFDGENLEPDKAVTAGELAYTSCVVAGLEPEIIESAFDTAKSLGIVSSQSKTDDTVTDGDCQNAIEASKRTYLSDNKPERMEAVFQNTLRRLTGPVNAGVTIQGDTLRFDSSVIEGINGAGEDLNVTVKNGGEEITVGIGDVVITEATLEHPSGTAYKITQIRADGSGALLETEKPDLSDIYKELDVHKTAEADWNLTILAEGVTERTNVGTLAYDGGAAVKTLASSLNSGNGTVDREISFGISLSKGKPAKIIAGNINASLGNGDAAEALDKSNFKYEDKPGVEDFTDKKSWTKKLAKAAKYESGYEITGIITIKELSVTVDMEYYEANVLGLFSVETSIPRSASIRLNSDIDAQLSMVGELEGRLKVATVPIPIGPTGLCVMVDIYIYAGVSGELEVEAQLQYNAKLGWRAPLNFEKVTEQDMKLESQIAVDVSFGADMNAVLDAFGIGIVDAGVKIGADVETEGAIKGEYDEQNGVDGGKTEKYTESLSLTSVLYAPNVTLYTGEAETIASALGAKADWEIVGKGHGAWKHTLFEKDFVFWTLTVILDPDGNIVNEQTTTGIGGTGEPGENAEKTLDALLNGDFSEFAGIYTYAYASLDEMQITDMTLDESGVISGGGYDFSPEFFKTKQPPILVTEGENGEYICTLDRGRIVNDRLDPNEPDSYFGEYYIIYPPGISAGNYHDNSIGVEKPRVYCVKIDGGVLNLMYIKAD